jgi:hypothetical protein
MTTTKKATTTSKAAATGLRTRNHRLVIPDQPDPLTVFTAWHAAPSTRGATPTRVMRPFLRWVSAQYALPEAYHYRNREALLLQHGRFFKTIRPQPETVPPGDLGDCFTNTFWQVMRDSGAWRYAEGYAIKDRRTLVPMPHAWVLDAQGRVVDPTWTPPGVAYFGVVFPYVTLLRFRGGQLLDVGQILRKPFQPT